MLLCLLVVGAAACKEERGIKVTSFTFKGTRAVSTGQLKSVLATSASAKVPWGTKRYFSREQFEADLKRIVAFYKDRGYPDARVTSVDAKLNDQQSSVAISVTISEGAPVRVERILFEGFEALPEQHRNALEAQLPLQPGQPRLLVHAGHLLASGQPLTHDCDHLAVGGRLLFQRPGWQQLEAGSHLDSGHDRVGAATVAAGGLAVGAHQHREQALHPAEVPARSAAE